MKGVLGLDIGGANLKAAHANGSAHSMAFPLWKQPNQLAEALARLVKGLPTYTDLAVTMTGELCDCFPTKRAGVTAILNAVEAAFPGRHIRVWRTDGRFADSTTARATPLQTGASNWHALVTFVGRLTEREPALLIDLGSTTTDIIPLLDGGPVPRGWTDAERLQTRELVYVGMTRTPVCALLGAEGMAEFFASTRDVGLLLDHLQEAPEDCDTADGRPATKEHAHARLARMVGADAESLDREQAILLAQRVWKEARRRIEMAIRKVVGNMREQPRRIIISGSGDTMAKEIVAETLPDCSIDMLRSRWSADVAQAACAFAVATLAEEMPDA